MLFRSLRSVFGLFVFRTTVIPTRVSHASRTRFAFVNAPCFYHNFRELPCPAWRRIAAARRRGSSGGLQRWILQDIQSRCRFYGQIGCSYLHVKRCLKHVWANFCHVLFVLVYVAPHSYQQMLGLWYIHTIRSAVKQC